MQKFYGEKEIVEIKDHPKYSGYQILVFKDGTEFPITKKMLAEAVTDKPIDLTQLRSLRCFPVVAAILGVLLEWDIHITEEIEFIDQRVIMSVNASLKKANEILWKKEDERKLTMLDVHEVLLSKNSDGGIPSPYMPELKK